MKYMTFNSSCSYAGLANMLSFYGIDTTDREIAMEMRLPYLFGYEDGSYLSGPMLQGKKWFDLYLNPRGFALKEQLLPKERVISHLRQRNCAMLGLRVNEDGKHAVIYTGTEDGIFHFLNNKWESDPAPKALHLTEQELLSRLDENTMVAALEQIPPCAAPIRERMAASVRLLQAYRKDLITVCTAARPTAQLRKLLNPLFRPLLLDGITMLQLLGETRLHQHLTTIQRNFLTALRSDAETLTLSNHISIDALSDALDAYIQLIRHALEVS